MSLSLSMTQLNPNQETATNHVEGPLLVLAGAGSGKTRVVTHRIAKLIDIGILPSDILAVTFTNKAAEEMKTRIRTLKNAKVLASTFHSLGARILRESIFSLGFKNDFTIYDTDDSEKLLKSCLSQLNIPLEKGTVRKIRNAISSLKNDLVEPQDAKNKVEDPIYATAYDLYQKRLKECNAVDFDDLLYLTVKLLQSDSHARAEYQNRWLFVLIDEYQDTNFAQYTLAKLLVASHQNLFAVGDPDQSIYSWRGAQYQNILNFESDFPGAKVITLDQNYRSTANILQAANALIQHNSNRLHKDLWSDLGDGDKVGFFLGQNDRKEAEFVAKRIFERLTDDQISLNDIAIFYRTNAQSRTFEDALLLHKIPYQIIGGLSFYDRREIKDILSFLRMTLSNSDLLAFLRTINLPKRGLGNTTLEKLAQKSMEEALPIFTLCEEIVKNSSLYPDLKLSKRQKEGLSEYVKLIYTLRDLQTSLSMKELINQTISLTRYLSYLEEDPETLEDRKENLDELIGKALQWEEETENPTLSQFLEELSLRSTADTAETTSSVKLMTLHNSKGLEFHTVFLVGLEEDLFPHINTKEDPSLVEEERRLCYVGMTRAKRHLYLTSSSYRFMWGSPRFMRPSRFLKEIPSHFLKNFAAAPYPREETFSEDQEIDSSSFSIGERVLHKEFGVGTILNSYQGSFGLTYEVHFEDKETTRTLAAKYAKLIRVP